MKEQQPLKTLTLTKLLALTDKMNKMGYRDMEARKIADKEWDALINELDAAAGEGLVNRHVRFSVADGYAHYIITKVNKTWCWVQHIDYSDGYRYVGEIHGKIDRRVVESAVNWADRMKAIFAKKA